MNEIIGGILNNYDKPSERTVGDFFYFVTGSSQTGMITASVSVTGDFEHRPFELFMSCKTFWMDMSLGKD